MDFITSSAIEEICAQGTDGLLLASLWPKLVPELSSCGLGLSPSVKSAVWENLLKVPVLEFHLRNAALPAADPSIQCVEGAEKMKLKLVAKESLRDNFVGLYDAQSATSNISSRQRSTLERLAAARDDGIIQNQLAKEFNMQGKYLFYILKNLESRGLIMRQSAVVKTRDASGEEDSRNSPSVTTNIVYLSRFAKQLGPQQRIEITKEERAESSRTASGSITCGECSTIDLIEKDVTIKDYLPAMKAVCDKLELADGKVLVVTDIKHDLGYGGKSTGHRAWRTVCRRLKDAGLVEEFEAKVNEKVRPCLRLLKNFPTENNEPSLFLSGNSDRNEEVAQFGRRYQITEQVIELPLEHQVLDMIIAEGSAGLTLKEVSERLSLDNKRNHTRYLNIVSRFGLNLASENRGKCVAYRVWAPNFLWDDATNLSFPSKSKSKYIQASNCDGLESATPNLLNYNPSVSEGNIISVEEKAERETDAGHDDAHYEVVNTDKASNRPTNPEDILPEPEISGGDLQVTSVLSSDGKAGIPSETALSISHRSSKVGSAQRYPCLSLTADATQRQQRILERMQEDKFILRAELYRWLVSLEKDKCTTMDRKTIDRIVNKLQKEGHCKCVEINVPSFTNCSRSRRTQVILHPSVDNLSPPLLNDIHDRLRSFEMQSRGHGSSKLKNSKSVPVLEGVQRIQNSRVSDATTANSKHEIMRANGFVLAKMIRAKLLHCFLWDHLHSFPDNDFDSLTSASNPLCSYCQFPMEEAIKSIPVELFLQVVGSTQKFDDMMQKCKSGLRLVDLPVEQYRILMDSLATSRLSLVIDILRRLKLIRLVNDQHRGGDIEIPHAIVTHALELKPYVEEPLSILANSFSFISLDLRPRVRHDFILSSREAVDEYWQTLEYCYASADPKAATHAFPGSAVHEVFLFRAWASIRVMTAEQRAELLKRILMDFTSQKLSFKECRKIARDLNLTLEQVLRVYHDKCLKRLTRFQGSVAEEGVEGKMSANQSLSASRKRRKLSRPPLSDNIVEPVSEQLSHADTARLSDNVDCFREEHDEPVISLKEHNNLKIIEEEISIEQPGHNIENERSPNKRMKPTRQRSLWTDEADRQLVIQYIRHRAVRGAKFQRADWGSLSNLPAPPSACGKRLATLKKNRVFRKALMKLLNIVSKRYVKHLKKLHGHIGDGCISFIRSSLKGDGDRNISIEAQLTEEEWDDFSCPSINKLIEEVLRCKKITKLHASEEVQSDSSLHTNVDLSSSGYVEPLVFFIFLFALKIYCLSAVL
ncbi:hypothetical protein SAY87_017258 [Trapa incisa]|uniref:B-block binding subunit of TFIIIC n=1 Tax=Trapa incisa TaxID=236973 RepID=A0AAN7L7F3_9MYRT|nr:hypothetical protein SAY87_017258 [Trapa incisa]